MFKNMRKIHKLILILSIILTSCSNENELFIPYSNAEIEYWGRIDSTSVDAAQLSWSGTFIKMNFEGESIQALLKDETGNNYYNVIIDNDSVSILRPGTTKQYYEVASNLSKGKHSIERGK